MQVSGLSRDQAALPARSAGDYRARGDADYPPARSREGKVVVGRLHLLPRGANEVTKLREDIEIKKTELEQSQFSL